MLKNICLAWSLKLANLNIVKGTCLVTPTAHAGPVGSPSPSQGHLHSEHFSNAPSNQTAMILCNMALPVGLCPCLGAHRTKKSIWCILDSLGRLNIHTKNIYSPKKQQQSINCLIELESIERKKYYIKKPRNNVEKNSGMLIEKAPSNNEK